MSNDGERTFRMVTWVSSLKEVFCSGGSCCLGQVTGPGEDVVVVEMVAGMVWKEVLNNLVILTTSMVVILVLPLSGDGHGRWWW